MLEWLGENGLGIVNGLDRIRDYTYLGPREFAVIYYVLLNKIEREKGGDVEVKTIQGSDNLIIIYSQVEKAKEKRIKKENKKRITIWEGEEIKKFREGIEGKEKTQN